MNVTKDMKDGVVLIRFKIPELGSYTISHNGWKYFDPFSHWSKKEKEEDKKERDKMAKFIIYHNGGGIGECNEIREGYSIIKIHAEEYLEWKLNEVKTTMDKLQSVIGFTKKPDWINLFRKE